MTQPRYVDPNSGAAPQPGGMVVGGAESQRGFAAEELSKAQQETLEATQEQYTENPPTSDQEAELQRQVEVTKAQAEADGGEPAKAETPNLAEPTDEQPPAAEEKPADETPTGGWEKVDESLTVSELKAVAKDEGVKGYSNMNEADLIAAINAKREADAAK